jgi:hypothetical protein
MTVARADANMTGSATSALPAGKTSDDVAPAKGTPSQRGPADDPNTTWLKPAKGANASARPAQKTSSTLPDDTKRAIDGAFEELNNAQISLGKAIALYNENRNDRELKEKYQKECDDAGEKVNIARANLGEVIKRETEKLALRSSLVPKGERHPNVKNQLGKAQLPSVRMVRHWEQVVVDTYKGFPAAQAEIKRQNHFAELFRLAHALKDLGVVMNATNDNLTAFQKEERDNIAADARNYVTGPRPEEAGLNGDELTKERLKRFDTLLTRVTKVTDPSRDKPLNLVAFDWVVGVIREQMGPLSVQETRDFNDIVALYRPLCTP